MNENHLPGTNTHPECPVGHVLAGYMSPIVAQNLLEEGKPWPTMVIGIPFEDIHGKKQVPTFVWTYDWEKKMAPVALPITIIPLPEPPVVPKKKGRPFGCKVINKKLYLAGEWKMSPEGIPIPLVEKTPTIVVEVEPEIVEVAPPVAKKKGPAKGSRFHNKKMWPPGTWENEPWAQKPAKAPKKPEASEETKIETEKPPKIPKPKGPVPGAKIRRFIQEMVGSDDRPERPKIPLPDWEINGGKPLTWTIVSSEDEPLYVSVYERLILTDGAKTINPGTLFPECSRAEMLRVRCNETDEIRIVLKEGFPKRVLGTTEERWRMKAADPDSGVSVFFSEAEEDLAIEASGEAA